MNSWITCVSFWKVPYIVHYFLQSFQLSYFTFQLSFQQLNAFAGPGQRVGFYGSQQPNGELFADQSELSPSWSEFKASGQSLFQQPGAHVPIIMQDFAPQPPAFSKLISTEDHGGHCLSLLFVKFVYLPIFISQGPGIKDIKEHYEFHKRTIYKCVSGDKKTNKEWCAS